MRSRTIADDLLLALDDRHHTLGDGHLDPQTLGQLQNRGSRRKALGHHAHLPLHLVGREAAGP